MQRYVQPLRALQFDRQEEIGLKILVTGRGFDAPGSHSLGIFELDQAKALQRFGHDVRFAAIDTRSPRRRRPLGLHRYELEGIPVAYAAIPSGSKPEFLSTWAQERAAAMVWSQLKKEGWRPDVIHSHFGAGFLPLTRQEMIPVYRGADAFVLASRMETFGVVYIEAMAAGLPVIATICGGPEDFVTPETGLLIEKENTDALAGAMAEMIRRTDFDSDAVARYARENFSPSVIAEKLTSVYKELI